jgi:methionine-rich copper-binding protein CopC
MRLGLCGILAAICATVLTGGCAGDGKGLDQNGDPIGSSSSSSGGASSGGSSGVTADFESIQQNIFTPICSKCHIGASAPEGLQLDAAHSYNLLVGVPSVEDSSLDRVKPGDPDHSYMVLKIEGAPGINGGQMPLAETPLPQATIDAIRQWITNGAMNAQASSLARAINRAAVQQFGFQSAAPADGAVVNAPVRQIVLAFNHEVDASLVNHTTIRLDRLTVASADAMLADATLPAALAAALQVAPHNPAVVLLTPSSPLGAGVYRVTLRGTGAAALADDDARVLGGDVTVQFTVQAAP